MDGESGVRVEEGLLVASACLSGSSKQGGARYYGGRPGLRRYPMAFLRWETKRSLLRGSDRKFMMSENGRSGMWSVLVV